jgi:hypothetical protein
MDLFSKPVYIPSIPLNLVSKPILIFDIGHQTKKLWSKYQRDVKQAA